MLINQLPSSLTLTHELASSNSKSCNSSTRFANSASCFKLRFRLRINQSGSGRAVDEPATVYTGTAEFVESFMVVVFMSASFLPSSRKCYQLSIFKVGPARCGRAEHCRAWVGSRTPKQQLSPTNIDQRGRGYLSTYCHIRMTVRSCLRFASPL